MEIDRILRRDLTFEQYAAVGDRSREVLCLAGAGAGKSRTLAYRIARLLADGASPESIVAFTFTEKAAESIKRRVAQALQASDMEPAIIGGMYIGTIHAYCQRVLGAMDAKYRQYDVLDENRLKLYLMRKYGLLALGEMRKRKGVGYFAAIGKVSDAWKTANDEMLDFEQVTSADGDGDPNIGELLAGIHRRMGSDQYIDFSAMISIVVEQLGKDASALAPLRHLMVDEYQDVNRSQEELIRLMHREAETLFVVGDDDQAIYGWRGADVTNILEFPERYPNCSRHTLAQNFRSTTPIVEVSDAFVTAELGPSRMLKAPIAASNQTPQDFRVLQFPDRAAEAEWVAARISELLGTAYDDDGIVRGLTPADFAILMRSTRSKEQDGTYRHTAFTRALDAVGIPYSMESGGGPFGRPQTAALRDTFELLRKEAPNRDTVRGHYNESVQPAYPKSDFNALTSVLADWGSQIHQPGNGGRLRLYPQEMMYQLLKALRIAEAGFDDAVMRDIGLFSRMMLDFETVYSHIGSAWDFGSLLNFLNNPAESGYDVSTDDVVQRPDAVTVSTVHKVKGLEFPGVFLVDVEQGRFSGSNSKYQGWLPGSVMADATARGAYRNTRAQEIRLFYTAVTRAERYLYVTGATKLPGGKQDRKMSGYAQRLGKHDAVLDQPSGLPAGLKPAAPRQRVEDADYPTNFSEIKYYLDCPKSYQFSRRYGFNPVIGELFGYGKSVHTSIQKLHELYQDAAPANAQIETVVADTFHLKHVSPSSDPDGNPGPYEMARASAVRAAQGYVQSYGSDFERRRGQEVPFEIPAAGCVISGSIDLLLKEDAQGNILEAEIIDFKTMDSTAPDDDAAMIDWTELALQVQLYTRAAERALGENAGTGSVHFLKDNRRVQVPIDGAALQAAIDNIEWAVQGILGSDFPMRPHPYKCQECDFQRICPQSPQDFARLQRQPPELHLPGGGRQMARAFSQYRPACSGSGRG